MEEIEQLLQNAPNDVPPQHIQLLPHEQFIANIKLSGYGFLPKEVITTQHRLPPPTHIQSFPSNLNTYPPTPYCVNYAYTDGSTMCNPGKSSAAWICNLSQYSRISCGSFATQQAYNILFPCSINVAELYAIKKFISNVYDYHKYSPWPINTTFNIYTDSRFCNNFFQSNYIPSTYYYWKQREDIFQYLNYLDQNNVGFNIRKVRAHVQQNMNLHEQNNNIVDELAQQTRIQNQNPIFCDQSYYEYFYNNNNNYINAFYRRQLHQKCQNAHSTQSQHNYLFHIPDSKSLFDEMRMFTIPEMRKLNKLRMGYLLNYHSGQVINNLCACSPDSHLSLRHLLYYCPRYNLARIQYRCEIMKIEDLYLIDENYFNPYFLLFPHLLYEYKDLRKFDNLTKRYKLLKLLIAFTDCRCTP